MLAFFAGLAPRAAQAFGPKPITAATIYCENRQDLTGNQFLLQAFRFDVGPTTSGANFDVRGSVRLDSAFDRAVVSVATGVFRTDEISLRIVDVGALDIKRTPEGTYAGSATFFSKVSANDLICAVK
jgi:hypothetical protein